ncbi:MAG: hypothetical protein EBR82_21115 [Caulobacteraceae bacterium]|nr:hypothetical protein [Caulobacteraceae bacterium]
MKLLEFSYTKEDGSVSNRAVIELIAPSKFIEGWDVSNLDNQTFAEFSQSMGELRRKQHEETMALLADFDLKHNYRRFKPESMKDIQVEYV